MLRSLKDLEHYTVQASDGDIGKDVNFLLDDDRWTVRYLVVDTGSFLEGRHVLVSPISFRTVDEATQRFHVDLTRAKVKNSPSVEVDKPVSRQHERDYLRYYGYSSYWGYSGVWGLGAYPGLLMGAMPSRPPADAQPEPPGDAHLRSVNELHGYHIQGSDEAIGHVEDFVVDDETWTIRYLVVDTRNWWFGKKVLVAPHWASRISYADRKVQIDLSRETIKNSPEWDGNARIDRDYETRLHGYYGLPAYWASGDPTAASSAGRAGYVAQL